MTKVSIGALTLQLVLVTASNNTSQTWTKFTMAKGLPLNGECIDLHTCNSNSPLTASSVDKMRDIGNITGTSLISTGM